MKLKDFIKYLQSLPPEQQEMRVIVNGYEGGFHDIEETSVIPIKLNDWHSWYYGPHEQVSLDEPNDELAVLIKRIPNPNAK